MQIIKLIPSLEAILSKWQTAIGTEYLGYRNHVYRMIHFCLALKTCTPQETEKIIIAAAFHDIGIWTKDTIDYIEPSVIQAKTYLIDNNQESWIEEITLMIREHHKIRQYKNPNYPLVELFRKGDLVDFSFGTIKFGLSKDHIEKVKKEFPNANFHKNLRKRAVRWLIKHPLNPIPMLKW